MNRKSLLAGSVAAALLTLAGGPVSAQITPQTPVTTPVNPGFFFWSIGANAGIRHLPRWTYGEGLDIQSETIVSRGFSFNPKPWGAGPEFVMGYALNRAGLLGGLGDVPRIELGLTTFFGQTTQSSTISGPNIGVVIPFIDSSSGFTTAEGTYKAKLETTVYSGEAAIRFKTSFKVNPRFQIIPSVAAIGGMAFYRYELETNVLRQNLDGVAVGVKETIRSWHVGGEFALQLKWTINNRWSINGGASAAAMYRRSDLNALSQFGGDFGTEAFTAKDNDSKFAWRLGLNVGVTYDWGWARLTLSGFGYWDSAVPGVENPKVDIATENLSRTRITHSGEWAYGGRIALVFPIFMGR